MRHSNICTFFNKTAVQTSNYSYYSMVLWMSSIVYIIKY
ncbi:hypothetical protein HMPREF9406_1561 [Clostridium sp. HGF2]|nr:hypothetical protein HMPREF9406_1561 [Clostridium sp. HGF2]EQJ53982.1 hypothetical protein QSI_3456 [Clostridioides difficile P28]